MPRVGGGADCNVVWGGFEIRRQDREESWKYGGITGSLRNI
jgi:hypothetical protein